MDLRHAGEPHDTVNVYAVDDWCEGGLPARTRQPWQAQFLTTLRGTAAWEQVLGITGERHRRIATEGALLGGLIENEFSLDLAIISDGASQFAILWHALGWVHAERLVHQLIPLNERHRADQERVRGENWDLYADLKKTCRKLGVSCWDSLGDRINQLGAIPPLPDLIRQRATGAAASP